MASSLSVNEKQRYSCALLLSLLYALGYSALTLAIGNSTIPTNNGVYKSGLIGQRAGLLPGQGMEDFLDPANFLYFPLMSHLVNWITIVPEITLRLALINSIFGAIAVGFTSLLLIELRFSLRTALLGSILAGGLGVPLVLAISSEDITPTYCFAVAATWLLSKSFNATRGSLILLILATVLLSISWLFHWSVITYSVPAFTLALILSPGSLRSRLLRLFLFLGTTLGTACFAALCYGESLSYVLFVSKGQGSGWLGWHWDKLYQLYIGIRDYFIFTHGADGVAYTSSTSLERGAAVALALLAFGGFGLGLRQCQRSAQPLAGWYALAGYFFFGQLVNLYVQPKEPQFQIGPMLLSSVGLAVIIERVKILPLLMLFALAPGVVNIVRFMMPHAAESDRTRFAAVRAWERHFAPESTAYIMHWGNGSLDAWAFAHAWLGRNFSRITPCQMLVKSPNLSAEELTEIFLNYVERERRQGRIVLSAMLPQVHRPKRSYCCCGIDPENQIAQALLSLQKRYYWKVIPPFKGVGEYYQLLAPRVESPDTGTVPQR